MSLRLLALALTLAGPAPAQPASTQPAKGGSAVSKPLAIGDGATALHGTLLAPGSGPKGPAVLIIAGSGPTDRDGNNPLGVSAGTYKLLAEGLAARGLTTLRFDKRGVAESAGAGGREEDLRFETLADDAKAWAVRLKAETGAPCVWLLGHSEGALIAEVAARDNPEVCGLILVSGAGRKAGDLLREQLSGPALPEPLRAPALEAITELEAGRAVQAPPALAALFRTSVQPYIISWFRHDPAELLRAYPRPILILQGTTDLQTSPADAQRLSEANPKARLVMLDGVNHVLKSAPLDRAANLATYADPNPPLAPGVVEAVAGFVAGRQP